MQKAIHLILLILSSSLLFLNLSAQEICFNRIDDDGDGYIDCADPQCFDASSCWQCETEFYQVHSNSVIVSLDPASGVYNEIGTISGASQINGAQFNHVDGHVYAPCIINNEHKLGMLSQDGTVNDTGLTLPGNSIFYAGAISGDGVMYLSNGSGIHYVDLKYETLSVVNAGAPHPGVADFALDITKNLFYGVASGGVLKVFNPFDLTVTPYQLAGNIVSDGGGYGAAWSCVDGSFFAYNNSSGKIYSVNINDLTATQVLNATGNLSINDGFNCVMSPPPFETNCNNGADDDGDGFPDCDDPDCYNSNSCIVEICNNGIDDDLDGWADCDDTECYTLNTCLEICDNGVDDNGNGLADGEDAQCTTGSGVGGGLESNARLSDKIAARNYDRSVNECYDYKNKKAGTVPFVNLTFKSETDIADFIPDAMWDAYVAESSPDDLTGITNATAVSAADYYVNDVRVGTVLGIETSAGVYEHAKYICDRSEGARLVDVSYLYSMGGNFISYEMLSAAGNTEYAVSFSSNKVGEGFNIESHWDLDQFPADEHYYNFQIWAKSYVELIDLLEAVLERIEAEGSILEMNTSDLPQVFIVQANYEDAAVKLRVRNKNHTPEVTVSGIMRKTETASNETFSSTQALSGDQEQWLYLETGHLYDVGLSLIIEDGPTDEVFLADGAWGLDATDEFASVQNYVVKDEEIQMDESVFQIERSVSLNALVKDYVNVYRALGPKFLEQDLNEYNSLVFEASGVGAVEVTLVKAGIAEWTDQFRTTIQLSEEKQWYVLRKSDLASQTYGQMDFSDLTMIVFSLMGNKETFEQKSIEISSARFENQLMLGIDDLHDHQLISPNPVQDVLFFSELDKFPSAERIMIYNSSGKTMGVYNISGDSSMKIDLGHLLPGMYMYSLNGKEGKILGGKFLQE